MAYRPRCRALGIHTRTYRNKKKKKGGRGLTPASSKRWRCLSGIPEIESDAREYKPSTLKRNIFIRMSAYNTLCSESDLRDIPGNKLEV